MSIFKYFFDNEYWQRSDIERLKERAERLERRSAARVKDLSHDLEERLGRLELVVESLGRLIVDKGVVTRDDFARVMTAVDIEDGVLDGRRTRHPKGGN